MQLNFDDDLALAAADWLRARRAMRAQIRLAQTVANMDCVEAVMEHLDAERTLAYVVAKYLGETADE